MYIGRTVWSMFVMIKVDLKPCPFCGGIPELRQFANPKNFYTVPVSYTHLDVYKRQVLTLKPKRILVLSQDT